MRCGCDAQLKKLRVNNRILARALSDQKIEANHWCTEAITLKGELQELQEKLLRMPGSNIHVKNVFVEAEKQIKECYESMDKDFNSALDRIVQAVEKLTKVKQLVGAIPNVLQPLCQGPSNIFSRTSGSRIPLRPSGSSPSPRQRAVPPMISGHVLQPAMVPLPKLKINLNDRTGNHFFVQGENGFNMSTIGEQSSPGNNMVSEVQLSSDAEEEHQPVDDETTPPDDSMLGSQPQNDLERLNEDTPRRYSLRDKTDTSPEPQATRPVRVKVRNRNQIQSRKGTGRRSGTGRSSTSRMSESPPEISVDSVEEEEVHTPTPDDDPLEGPSWLLDVEQSQTSRTSFQAVPEDKNLTCKIVTNMEMTLPVSTSTTEQNPTSIENHIESLLQDESKPTTSKKKFFKTREMELFENIPEKGERTPFDLSMLNDSVGNLPPFSSCRTTEKENLPPQSFNNGNESVRLCEVSVVLEDIMKSPMKSPVLEDIMKSPMSLSPVLEDIMKSPMKSPVLEDIMSPMKSPKTLCRVTQTESQSSHNLRKLRRLPRRTLQYTENYNEDEEIEQIKKSKRTKKTTKLDGERHSAAVSPNKAPIFESFDGFQPCSDELSDLQFLGAAPETNIESSKTEAKLNRNEDFEILEPCSDDLPDLQYLGAAPETSTESKSSKTKAKLNRNVNSVQDNYEVRKSSESINNAKEHPPDACRRKRRAALRISSLKEVCINRKMRRGKNYAVIIGDQEAKQTQR